MDIKSITISDMLKIGVVLVLCGANYAKLDYLSEQIKSSTMITNELHTRLDKLELSIDELKIRLDLTDENKQYGSFATGRTRGK